jgi:hypothetical protein
MSTDPSPPPPADRTLDFPPAPWRVSGTMQVGLLPPAQPPTVQHGLKHLLPGRLVVGLMRYLGGDLRYDLFFLASPVRHRHRIGMYFHHLSVSSPAAAQAAGHWGLPATTATLSWDGPQIRVDDHSGFRIELAMTPRIPIATPTLLPLSTFGTRGDWLIHCPITARTLIRPGTMRITTWPEQLPVLRRHTTAAAIDVPHFRMHVPQAVPIALL